MQVFRATLEARDPAKGCFRSYQIDAGQDLFGVWIVDITYGRIGTRGTHVRYSAPDEASAQRIVHSKLNRRATARKRMGVSYRVRELIVPATWTEQDLTMCILIAIHRSNSGMLVGYSAPSKG
jgi:hypothetical protein